MEAWIFYSPWFPRFFVKVPADIKKGASPGIPGATAPFDVCPE